MSLSTFARDPRVAEPGATGRPHDAHVPAWVHVLDELNSEAVVTPATAPSARKRPEEGDGGMEIREVTRA
jgi:hypothetical protein